MTGGFAVESADGAGTILFDIRSRDWSPEVLQALEIPLEWLPENLRRLRGDRRRSPLKPPGRPGLKAGTPVVGGGGDQAAQAVGVGAVEPGIIALTLGTSGVVFATTQGRSSSPKDGCTHFAILFPIAGT